MFDSGVELPAVGAAQLAALIEQNHAELMARECRMLQLACAWADAHYLDSGGDDYQPLIQRASVWGGEGTPEVSEYCAAELGALQGTGIMAARSLIADALDLRYRLPRLWNRVLTGGVRARQARKIAEQTRPLSWEACADVDHALSDFVGMMPWPRFAKILSATILDADPALAAERAERARHSQDVFSFDSEDGLKTIVAKAAAGDAIWFLATVNRIAEILAARGDIDPIGTRRARAVGILARPAEALQLLIGHQYDPAEQSLESNGSEPEPEADDHQSLAMTMPADFDAAAARPRVVLHYHLSDAALRSGDAIVRPEDGDALRLDQLREFLSTTGCHVRVQPVLDPTAVAPVDGYEVPQRLRAAVRARQIADVFPFSTCISTKWISTTPNGTCQQTTAGRQDRPDSATSAPSPAPDTEPSPTAAGPNTSPNPDTSQSAHHWDMCTWSPTMAPSPWAAPHSAQPSGKPQHPNRPPYPPSRRKFGLARYGRSAPVRSSPSSASISGA
jgi:hypothetical protein